MTKWPNVVWASDVGTGRSEAVSAGAGRLERIIVYSTTCRPRELTNDIELSIVFAEVLETPEEPVSYGLTDWAMNAYKRAATQR